MIFQVMPNRFSLSWEDSSYFRAFWQNISSPPCNRLTYFHGRNKCGKEAKFHELDANKAGLATGWLGGWQEIGVLPIEGSGRFSWSFHDVLSMLMMGSEKLSWWGESGVDWEWQAKGIIWYNYRYCLVCFFIFQAPKMWGWSSPVDRHSFGLVVFPHVSGDEPRLGDRPTSSGVAARERYPTRSEGATRNLVDSGILVSLRLFVQRVLVTRNSGILDCLFCSLEQRPFGRSNLAAGWVIELPGAYRLLGLLLEQEVLANDLRGYRQEECMEVGRNAGIFKDILIFVFIKAFLRRA